MKKWAIRGLVIGVGCVLLLSKICFFSTMKASVALSETANCEVRTNGLYHWFTDRRIPLVHWDNGHEAGHVDFRFTPECYPTAIFPTEDNRNVFCFYETDLTIALFVVELNNRSIPDHSPPQGFFRSPSIISYTDFALRRCTRDEVAYLMRYIRSCDDATLRKLCVTGLPFPYHASSTREFLLTKIEHITTSSRVPLAGEIPEVLPQ
jgi:hypothetical protein